MTRSERIKQAGDALAVWVDMVSRRCTMSEEEAKSGGGRVGTWREATAADAPGATRPGPHFFKRGRYCLEAIEVRLAENGYHICMALWEERPHLRPSMKERIVAAWRTLSGRDQPVGMIALPPDVILDLADTLVGLADHIEATSRDEEKTPAPD